MSELEYHAIRCYYLLDNVLENECMEELASIASAQYKAEHTITARDIFNRMIDYIKHDKCFGYEIAVPIMYIMVSLLFVFCKKWKEILPIAALFISRYMIFAYLMIRGRMPYRVVNILFFAELLLLLAIFVKSYFENEDMRKKLTKVKYLCMLVFAVIMSSAITRSYAEAENTNKLNEAYEAAIFNIFDYMEEKGGGFIVCDDVTTYYRGSALGTKRYQGQNSLVAGGWFYNSPMMNEAIVNYKEKYSDNMYCIVFKDVPGFDHSFVLTLLPEEYDVNLKLEDTLYLEALGLTYEVYKLEGSVQ